MIEESKILVVGAGGIGCELLKNLVLCGCKDLHVLDLDLVDTTNLNRQFFFRRNHVGMSKAHVARSAVLEFRPTARIVAHHANVMDREFGREFMAQFDLVLNALDNEEARRHVNRMCFLTDVPLIDSGSAGFSGQVMPIVPGVSRCYDCQSHLRQRTYAVCTIRSTPSKPEHCVAWGRYLFDLLFGPESEDNELSDFRAALGPLQAPPPPLQEGSSATQTSDTGANERIVRVFRFLFDEEVTKQADMKEQWDAGQRPRPLKTEDYVQVLRVNSMLQEQQTAAPAGLLRQHHVCTLEECVRQFATALQQLFETHEACNKGSGSVAFDKSDELAMAFVAAAANLRMYNFHINLISRWTAESIAGSIIPAVASTNAIVAGLQTVQAIRLLNALGQRKLKTLEASLSTAVNPGAKQIQQPLRSERVPDQLEALTRRGILHVWVKPIPLGPYLLLPEQLEPASAKCTVCQTERVTLTLNNIGEWSLSDLIETVLQKELGCGNPIVEVGETRVCIYAPEMAEDDPSFAVNKLKSLKHWGVSKGSSLFVIDSSNGPFECEMLIEASVPEVTGAGRTFSMNRRPARGNSSHKRPKSTESDDPNVPGKKARRDSTVNNDVLADAYVRRDNIGDEAADDESSCSSSCGLLDFPEEADDDIVDSDQEVEIIKVREKA